MTEKGEEAYKNSVRRESLRNKFSILLDDEKKQLISCLMRVNAQALKYTVSMPTLPLL